MVGVVKEEVEAILRIKHSPGQISIALKLNGLEVSHTTIYQHIVRAKKAGGNLASNLRINGKPHYRWRSKMGRGEKIPHWVDIDLIPTVVDTRERFGDWEADLIQGGDESVFLVSLTSARAAWGCFI